MSTFNPSNIIRSFNQLATSEEVQNQLKKMLEQKTPRLKIQSPTGEREVKLTFHAEDFRNTLASTNNLKALVELLYAQMQKEQVLFKEKINGRATFYANKEVMDRIRKGDLTIMTKSGEKKVGIESETPAEEKDKQTKYMPLQEYETGSVSSAAEELKDVLLKIVEELSEETAAETAHEKKESAREHTPTLPKQKEKPKEFPKQESTKAEPLVTMLQPKEKQQEKREAGEDLAEEFYETEKEKDEKWTEKHDMIVKKEEMKKEQLKQEEEEEETK
jgi:hypothetical protein